MHELRGTRLLIVEDEPMLLLDLQDITSEFGCEIVGTAAHLSRALDLARSADFDVAILDVNLNGDRIRPVADAIADRCRPIVFLTGYAGDFEGRPNHGIIIEKPCDPDDIARALQHAIGSMT